MDYINTSMDNVCVLYRGAAEQKWTWFVYLSEYGESASYVCERYDKLDPKDAPHIVVPKQNVHVIAEHLNGLPLDDAYVWVHEFLALPEETRNTLLILLGG